MRANKEDISFDNQDPTDIEHLVTKKLSSISKFKLKFTDYVFLHSRIIRWGLCCKKFCRNQKFNYHNISKSEDLYTNEVDITSIVNSIRQLRIAMGIILTENQRKILKFSRYRNLDDKVCTEDNLSFCKRYHLRKMKRKFIEQLEQCINNRLNQITGTILPVI